MNAPVALTPSGKEAALDAFIRQLHRDGLTLTELAILARVGRTTLSQMLHTKYTGKHTWKHVIPLLTNEALFCLKQCSAWNIHTALAAAARGPSAAPCLVVGNPNAVVLIPSSL